MPLHLSLIHILQAERTVERTTEYINFTAAEKMNFQKTCLAIKDRPAFIHDEAWIFKRECGNEKFWNSKRLYDEKYCEMCIRDRTYYEQD